MKHESPAAAATEFQGITPDNYFDYKSNRSQRLKGTWSKSELTYVLEDPHRWAAALPKEYKSSMFMGSVIDCLMTEPEKFDQTYLVTECENLALKEGRDAKTRAEAEGKILLKKSQLVVAESMIDAVTGHPEGLKMIKGEPQKVFTSTCQVKGPEGIAHVAVKMKTDYVVDNGDGSVDVWDLKKTMLTSDDMIAKVARDKGYHLQEDLYTRIIQSTGLFVRSFKFIFVCDEAPYRVRVVEFDDEALAGANTSIKKAFSIVYAIGHGAHPAELESKTLLLGRKREVARSWWELGPDIPPEHQVTVTF